MRFRISFAAALMIALSLAPPTSTARAQSEAITRQTTAAKRSIDTLDAKVRANVKRYCGLSPSSTLSYMRNSLCVYYERETTRLRVAIDSLRTLLTPIVPPPPPPPVVSVATLAIHANASTVNTGQTLQLIAEPKSAAGVTLTTPIAWGSTPTALCDVSGTGLLTGKGAGACTVTARADTVSISRVFTVVDTLPQPPPPPPPPPPPAVDTSGAIPPVPGRATLAELPRATVDVVRPLGYNVVNVAAQAGALQAAIDAAGCRAEIRLAQGFSYTPIVLRQKPCNERYHTVILTGNGMPAIARGVRVTPSLSEQRQQGKIVSANAGNAAAVTADQNVHGYYFEDIAILGGGTSDINALIRLGVDQTTMAQVPGDFVFSHVYASGTPTLKLKRIWYLNSSSTAIVDSWGGEAHNNDGDSQCILGLNGPGPYLIDNIYCEASHEVIMFGGGDPSIPNLVPSDITIRHSHITRPVAWRMVWTVKNLIETKNVRRMLLEGNVIESNWGDGQVGYALLFKSVNQDGTAPWSVSEDITVRYNLIRNTGAGINLCAACQGTVVPASRLTFYDNIILGVNVGPYTGEARQLQFLGALKNVSLTHNTSIVTADVGTAISFDGQPPKITGFDVRSNVYEAGQYNIHGGSGGSDWRLFADTATTNWTHNLAIVTSANCQGASWCASLPQTYQAAGFDARGVLSSTATWPTHDARPIGANAAKVYAMTAGVVVADPLRQARPRAVASPRQTGYHPTSPEQRQRDTRGGGSRVQ